jgi:hypothetical protein
MVFGLGEAKQNDLIVRLSQKVAILESESVKNATLIALLDTNLRSLRGLVNRKVNNDRTEQFEEEETAISGLYRR